MTYNKVSKTEDQDEKQPEANSKDSPAEKPTESSKQEDESSPAITEDLSSPESEKNPKSPSADEENGSPKHQKGENDQNDPNNPQSPQKPLKKPDKILPCPRCNSMDTKFCYYNNYNINQPRHFCKSCQRYWTAGGTMRNVPVGAGRRKNKNSVSHCRHITISEALQAARIDHAPNGIHHPAFKPNSTVLSFGPEAPLCESMASVLNLAEKRATNEIQNGFYKVDHVVGENGDDCSSGSSVTTLNSTEEVVRNGLQETVIGTINGFSSQFPCLPVVPWPYPWNSAVPVPAFCPSGYPMPFYPAPYWNCGFPGAWSVPWISPPSPARAQKPTGSSPDSSLGKHSRNGDLIRSSEPEGKESQLVEQKNSEQSCVLIPKTLRINDPDEAARSSLWATLGIKNDLFQGFQAKGDQKKNHIPETPPALRANPAALSRSLSFQEGA
ncbi:unnamed protein product [Thlaspi arvense]|uniref:Dof-type domain-containing protein n=1 Tax=Thlaspi arvense TaxID=13288 RepID=A0AAU9RGV7_THLAR|nr:unnamed protein product [Thlaspi arvense]